MTIAQLVECEPDVTRLQQQLRVLRLKMGAAIERLEHCELPPAVFDQVQSSLAGVTCEVDSLLITLKCECC